MRPKIDDSVFLAALTEKWQTADDVAKKVVQGSEQDGRMSGNYDGALKAAAKRIGIPMQDHRGYGADSQLDVQAVCTVCHHRRERERRNAAIKN